jgi:hypothetical protein
MPYLRGVFVNFGEETYYLSCGIVNGGNLDTETYTINNPELMMVRMGRDIYIVTSELKLLIPVEPVRVLLNSETSKVYNEVLSQGNEVRPS